MSYRRRVEWLYLANLALIFTHQVDAAVWKEWEMFFGPRSTLEGFLLANAALLLLALYGFRATVRWDPSGPWFSLGAGAAGLVTFGIHLAFILSGWRQFTTLLSLAILTLILLVSLPQLALSISLLRRV